MRGAVLLVTVLGATACVHADERETSTVPEPRPAGVEAVECDETQIRVEFDPQDEIVITAGDRTLASASATRRTLSKDCEPLDDLPLQHEGPGETVHERVNVRCALPAPAQVRFETFFDEVDERGGTSLVVAVPLGEPVIAASLEDDPDPQAWSLFFDSRYCERESRR